MAQKHRNRPTYGARTRKSEHKRFACKQIIDCASVRLCSDCRASKVHRFGAGVYVKVRCSGMGPENGGRARPDAQWRRAKSRLPL